MGYGMHMMSVQDDSRHPFYLDDLGLPSETWNREGPADLRLEYQPRNGHRIDFAILGGASELSLSQAVWLVDQLGSLAFRAGLYTHLGKAALPRTICLSEGDAVRVDGRFGEVVEGWRLARKTLASQEDTPETYLTAEVEIEGIRHRVKAEHGVFVLGEHNVIMPPERV